MVNYGNHQRGENVFKQGVLPVSYECEPTEAGMTALAGLPAYLELAIVSGLTDFIQRHLVVSGTVWQGRRDACHHEE